MVLPPSELWMNLAPPEFPMRLSAVSLFNTLLDPCRLGGLQSLARLSSGIIFFSTLVKEINKDSDRITNLLFVL